MKDEFDENRRNEMSKVTLTKEMGNLKMLGTAMTPDFFIEHRACMDIKLTPIENIMMENLEIFRNTLMWFEIKPQAQIGRYRVDFLVTRSDERTDKCQIVIECDGHEFHEKTKEQAAKDKKRDRWLQTKGFKVFRFTGSEIWNAPNRCCLEVVGAFATHSYAKRFGF